MVRQWFFLNTNFKVSHCEDSNVLSEKNYPFWIIFLSYINSKWSVTPWIFRESLLKRPLSSLSFALRRWILTNFFRKFVGFKNQIDYNQTSRSIIIGIIDVISPVSSPVDFAVNN